MAGETLVLVPRAVTLMETVACVEVRAAVQTLATTVPQWSGSPRSVTVKVTESGPE